MLALGVVRRRAAWFRACCFRNYSERREDRGREGGREGRREREREREEGEERQRFRAKKKEKNERKQTRPGLVLDFPFPKLTCLFNSK